MEHPTKLQIFISLGFLFVNVALTVIVLILAVSSIQQRAEIKCILLILPENRTEETINKCSR